MTRIDYSPETITRWNLDGAPPALLTTGNPKTAKGEGLGYFTAILHLAPASAPGTFNACPYATDGCAAACLNTAGRGGIALDADGLNAIQAARIRRSRFFKRDRAEFLGELSAEIKRHIRRAIKNGLKPAVRLNGTSDLPFERFQVSRNGEKFANLIEAFPEVRFYDYTKWPMHLRQATASYPLTFSLAESNARVARKALAAGANVAVVFATKKGAALPASYDIGTGPVPVIDGDAHDLRFMDPKGVIVGLRAKGRAKGSETGFVRNPNPVATN